MRYFLCFILLIQSAYCYDFLLPESSYEATMEEIELVAEDVAPEEEVLDTANEVQVIEESVDPISKFLEPLPRPETITALIPSTRDCADGTCPLSVADTSEVCAIPDACAVPEYSACIPTYSACTSQWNYTMPRTCTHSTRFHGLRRYRCR